MVTCARFSTTRKSSVRPLRTGGTKVGADDEPVDKNTHVTSPQGRRFWRESQRALHSPFGKRRRVGRIFVKRKTGFTNRLAMLDLAKM